MDVHALPLTVLSHQQKKQSNSMGIGFLDNLENAWDENLSLESKPIIEINNMGREKFWEDLGRPSDDGK